MKKLLVLVGVGIGAAFVLRRFGGRLGERLQSKRAGMMARMMEECGPCAEMFGGVQEIREQNQRIISLLEERLAGDGPTSAREQEPADESSEG